MGKAGLKLKTKALVCHSVLLASDRSEQHNKRTTKFDSQEQAEYTVYNFELRPCHSTQSETKNIPAANHVIGLDQQSDTVATFKRQPD